MASLGEVVSTALTGGDSPVFNSTPKEIKALEKQSSNTSAGVDAVNAKVDALTEAFTKFLEAQAVAVEPEQVPEQEPEKAPTKAKTTAK
jgi:hypothetical protein